MLKKPRRVRKQNERCPGCGLPFDVCICALAPQLEIQTEFIIVSHAKEMIRASNTARLAKLVMPETRILQRGIRDQRIDPGAFRREGAAVFVLYPSDDALELNEALVQTRQKPWVVVVPDGSWRQAASTVRREEGLQGLPFLKLPPGPESRYLLRNQLFPGRVSTFEAIARVLGILEGPKIQALLEAYLDEMVVRSLTASGKTDRLNRLFA